MQTCRLAFAALLPLFTCACGSAEPGPGELRVAAAADLRFALEEVAHTFAARGGATLRVSYGSSGNFYSQLLNQAPFDLFLSADLDYPRNLSRQGLTLPESEFTYATGRIVLWTPAASPLDVEHRGIVALSDPRVAHISIANPEHAPYGRAAEAAMRSLGVYDAARPKLVLGENVSQALQFVQSGNAEIGIVALSLAVSPAARDQGRYWEIPAESYPLLEQGGVILKWARNPAAAQALRAFLLSAEGRETLQRHGLFPPRE